MQKKSVLTPKTHVLTKSNRELFELRLKQAEENHRTVPHTLDGQLASLRRLQFARKVLAANTK